MKSNFLILLFSLFFNSAFGQLEYLFVKDYVSDKNKGDTYAQYNFSIKLENDIYNLKSIDGGKYYLKPHKRVYYEVFNDKVLLVTDIDSLFLKKGLSNAYFTFPRYKVYMFLIDSISNNKKYFVDFNGRIIYENNLSNDNKPNSFFIKSIDFQKREMLICNAMKKEIEVIKINED